MKYLPKNENEHPPKINPADKNSKIDYYPLGGNLFGYVQQRAGITSIHVRQFEYSPTKAKTIKTSRGVSMNLTQFEMLCRIKSKIVKDCKSPVLCQQIPSI